MITIPKTLIQSLGGALRRLSITRIAVDTFKTQFLLLLDSINDKETEEFHKNLVSKFLQETYYNLKDKPKNFINTKGRNDLVIHNGETPKTSVGVIIEAKKPTNSAEMPTLQNLNVKAFHELILYYLRERITHKNLEIKHLVITNVYEWFIFDVQEIDRLFAQNKTFVQQFQDFEEGRLADNRTDFFYKQIAEPFIKNLQEELSFTHFSIKDFETFARNNTPEDDKKLLELYKIFAPEHLLKLPFVNDSNTLDRGFYNELLHIMGLTEVKEGGKKLIQRKQEKDRDAGSILEETIAHLQGLGKMGRIPKLAAYGNTYQEQLFAVGLELCITWINRILFLKLLEAQLLSYHKGNKAYNFLTADNFSCASNLDVLFFQVLARKPHERSEELQRRFANVPYLNSSLFEVSELEHLTLVIGNLSTDIELPILPQTVLKDYKSNRKTGKLKTLDYLFAFLDAYDFGAEQKGDIQENNKPLITASVLGLVFEKINGYKDGSFFTPGFITMYMCAETIRKAVIQKFNAVKQWNCKSIAELYENIKDRKEANEIMNSLKICDPAVGSGHFLVSVLNELIAIKQELRLLLDRKGVILRDTRIKVENDELKITYDDGEPFIYYPKGVETTRIQETLFREKQNLIENCLFGVDINPNSVKICRLRLWIELLKNAYYTEESKYTELETLPNLDINIKVGNSLVSRFALDADLKQALKKSKWTVETYRNAITTYFRTTNREQKRELEKLIADIKADFRAEISKNDSRLVRKRKLEGEMYMLANQNLAFETEKEKKEKAKKIEKITQELAMVEAEIEEMKANRVFENAFEWRFEFPEVLNEEGDFVGFDVVVGNPPYIKEYEGKELFAGLHSNEAYQGKSDMWYLFVALATNLLKSNGLLSFIATNNWVTNAGASKLRNFLLENTKFLEFIDFSNYMVFDMASVQTMIMSFEKEQATNYSFTYRKLTNVKPDEDEVTALLLHEPHKNISVITPLIDKDNLYNQTFTFNNEDNEKVLTKIQAMANFYLDEKLEVAQGMVFPQDFINAASNYVLKDKFKIGNGVFVLTNKEKDDLQLTSTELELVKPYFTTEQLQRYYGINTNKLWLIYTTSKFKNPIEIEPYPNLKRHLDQFKDIISSDNKPYGLHRARVEDFFKGEKITVQRKCPKKPVFCYTDFDAYVSATFYVIKTERVNQKYLTGLLNSKLIEFWLKHKGKMQGNNFQIDKEPLLALPLVQANDTIQEQIANKVTMIINTKQANLEADISILETEIDNLVYQLYDLTAEEINIVENGTK